MATKNVYLKVAALALIVGVPALLWLGLAYGTLSLRQLLIGFMGWFAALMLWTVAAKLTTKKTLTTTTEPAIALDDNARKRIMREIWLRKVWIGILAASFLFAIANGIAQRLWLPVVVGAVISLLWMYLEARKIRRRREQLKLARQ